jgi:O-antigen/teichoic acid export membrane protein
VSVVSRRRVGAIPYDSWLAGGLLGVDEDVLEGDHLGPEIVPLGDQLLDGREIAHVGDQLVDEPEIAGLGDQPVDQAADDGHLRTQVSHGVKWGLIASLLTQAGRFGFMTVLMRLLGPYNFGIVGQAMVFVAVTQIFMHLGLATYIIQRPQIRKDDIGTAAWMNALVGGVLAAVTLAAAPLISAFFNSPELTTVLRVLSLAFLLKAIAVVPTALLNRDMRLRAIGIAEIAATFVSGGLGLAAALNGADYWALVIQTLAFDVVYAAIVLVNAGRPELTWSRAAAGRLWGFGSRVMGSDLVNYVSDNADKFLIARFLGATPLALYTLAYRVLVIPVQFLTQAGRVILPTFSRLQDERERLAHAFLRSTETLAMVIVPVMTLVVLCAPAGVPLVFGDSWAPAVVPLQLLSAMTAIHLLSTLTGPVVLAVGRADWELRWALFTVVVAIAAFAVGLQWGITGVAAAYLGIALVLNPVRFFIIQRLIPLTGRAYLRSLAPATVSSAALAVAWLAAAAALPAGVGPLGHLVAASVVGGVGFVLAARLLWPDDFRNLLGFARQVARRGGA